jgi:RES domain-containing protein
VLVWRLTKPEHAPGLDGEGARLFGGRWNSQGLPVVYCASSLALAALEVFVHLPPAMRRASALPGLTAVGLEVPDQMIADLSGFAAVPDRGEEREIGDRWLRGGSGLALRVPSAVIGREMNLLLNPRHPGIGRIALVVQEPFRFDDRLGG